MILTYEAVDADGRQKRDTVEAGNAHQAVDKLRRQGLYVTNITESVNQKRAALVTAEANAEIRIPLKTLVVFTRQMAMLLRAGAGVVPALSAIRRQTKKPALTRVISSLISDLEDGATLTEALRRFPAVFGPVYCALVAAGEASATITGMFERMADILAKHRSLRNKVIGAMTYPALLTCMCVAIIITLLVFVIPRFSQMFVQLGVDPPPSTQMLLNLADLLRTYWFIAALGAAAAVGGVVFLAASRWGRQMAADLQIVIPGLGRLRSGMIQGQIMRTMGTLLESRVGVLDALELVRGSTRNRRFQKLFDGVEHAVTSGGNLGTSFERSGLVDPYVCQAIITGEESGNLGPAMTYAADMLDETNAEVLSAVIKLVEPVILIGMGVVVGAVAISLFLPLFDLTSAIG
jgi:type II secretory pathway component PulF